MCRSHHLIFPTLKVLFIGLVILKTLNAESIGKLPCKFDDSIDITNGIFHPNKSITFNGLEYPVGQYAKINYIEEWENPHYRGCPCNIQPCIRMCCPFGSFTIAKKTEIWGCLPSEAAKHVTIEILEGYQLKAKVSLDHFSHVNLVQSSSCKTFFYLDDPIILNVRNEF